MDLNHRLNQKAPFRYLKKKVYALLNVLTFKSTRAYFHRLRLGYQLVTLTDSYLVESGFVQSTLSNSLTDRDGNHIPWMNYSFLEFLQPRLNKGQVVFEYGSGASTLFFSRHTHRIISVETNKSWYEQVYGQLTSAYPNACIHLEELNENYHKAIEKHMEPKSCDIIIIDGRQRVASAMYASDYLSDQGVIIIDDSHREQYQPAIDHYLNKGFKELTIKGIKPTKLHSAQTTILYRDNNCLGI